MYRRLSRQNRHKCPLLTEIPHIPGLQDLDCWNCPLLTKIPVIPGLQTLICYDCPLLTKIPKIPDISGLQFLEFSNCPLLTEIPDIPGLQKLDYQGSPWLKLSPEKLFLLVFLQRKIKKIVAKKRRIIGCPSYLLSTLEKY